MRYHYYCFFPARSGGNPSLQRVPVCKRYFFLQPHVTWYKLHVIHFSVTLVSPRPACFKYPWPTDTNNDGINISSRDRVLASFFFITAEMYIIASDPIHVWRQLPSLPVTLLLLRNWNSYKALQPQSPYDRTVASSSFKLSETVLPNS